MGYGKLLFVGVLCHQYVVSWTRVGVWVSLDAIVGRAV